MDYLFLYALYNKHASNNNKKTKKYRIQKGGAVAPFGRA